MTDTPALDIDRVNPYDDPGRQDLERRLETDQHVFANDQRAFIDAQTLYDDAARHGDPDAVATSLAGQRVDDAGHHLIDDHRQIAQDQQNIDAWDARHPDQAPATYYDPASTPTWGTGGQQTDSQPDPTQAAYDGSTTGDPYAQTQDPYAGYADSQQYAASDQSYDQSAAYYSGADTGSSDDVS